MTDADQRVAAERERWADWLYRLEFPLWGTFDAPPPISCRELAECWDRFGGYGVDRWMAEIRRACAGTALKAWAEQP